MQAVPPFGALQADRFFTLHFRTPLAVVRQHVTAPERPQVELPAHFLTCRSHDLGSVPVLTARFTTPAAHFTYLRWLAWAQGHAAVIIARTAAAADASGQPDPPSGSVVVVVAEHAPPKVPMLPASLVGVGQARPMLVPDRVRLMVPLPAGPAVVSVKPARSCPPACRWVRASS